MKHNPILHHPQLQLYISSKHGGTSTRFHLKGSLCRAIPYKALRRAFGRLSHYSGSPTKLVFSADKAPEIWWALWDRVLWRVPVPLPMARFKLMDFGGGDE